MQYTVKTEKNGNNLLQTQIIRDETQPTMKVISNEYVFNTEYVNQKIIYGGKE